MPILDGLPFAGIGPIVVFLEWKSQDKRLFYKSWDSINDYGKCCYIVPQLDFEDPQKMVKGKYSAEDWLNMKEGNAKPSISQGLRGFMDAEVYENAGDSMGSQGFRVSVGYAMGFLSF